VVVVTLLVMVTAYEISSRQHRLYEANAEVLLTYQDQAGVAITKLNPLVLAREATTQAKLARLTSIAQQTVSSISASRTAAQLLNESSVQSDLNDNLLQFSVTDADRALASKLANGYVNTFVLYHNQLAGDAVSAQLGALKVEIAKLEHRLVTGPQPARQVRAQLAPLLVRQQQLNQAILAQQGGVLPVQLAGVAKQVQPQPARDAVLGGLAGLVLGIALALVLNGLDTRVRSAEDAREYLGFPLVGHTPRLPRRFRKTGVIMLAEPESARADAYRRLHSSLEYASTAARPRALLVTSALAGEGKSTLVANLAVAAAQAGKRVVVLDLNLRRPVIARLFGVNDNPGAPQVLTGQAEITQSLTPISIAPPRTAPGTPSRNGQAGSLALLPTQAVPGTPAAYLTSGHLAELLGHVGESADLIIIDAPAMLPVSDAMPIAFLADAILVVVRSGVADRGALAELCGLLVGCPTPVLGFVLNDGQGQGHAHQYPRPNVVRLPDLTTAGIRRAQGH
jgi:Mrp family chromosome partitioning ATPase/capsular polysaccharide biosynthesis protein